MPKRPEAWLAGEAETHGWPYEAQTRCLPTGASSLTRIEPWSSVLPCEVLQPNHVVAAETLADTVLAFIQRCNETARPIRRPYTVRKLEQKLGSGSRKAMPQHWAAARIRKS